jgi:predicted ATPase
MYFELKNIGAINQAKIELGKLTVICGENNRGKTYISYSFYGFFKYLFSPGFQEVGDYLNSLAQKERLDTDLKEKGIVRVDLREFEQYRNEITTQLGQLYTPRLKEVFSANADEFVGAEFKIGTEKLIDYSEQYGKISQSNKGVIQASKNKNSPVLTITQNIDDEQIINYFIQAILFDLLVLKNFPRPFILTAERTGIQQFQKELDKNRSDLITTLTKTRDLALLDENVSRFALPLKDNIDFARNSSSVIKSNSFLKEEKPELTAYIEEMLGVQYEIIAGQKVVIDKTTHQTLPYDMSSTSVRALSDLHLWLKHQANKADILFIDEPELNLHPGNQIKTARLLVRLINNGIKVFITTHSDYIIKELNNLLMLADEFPNKEALMNEFGYTPDEILHENDLRAYIAHNGTLSRVDTDELGMIQSGFDDAIVQINETSNKIASAITHR